MERRIKTRPIRDMRTALYIYWNYPEIGNKEIQALFGISSSNATAKYKKIALDYMTEQGVSARGYTCVNTKAAYEAWGIDVADLEERLKRIQRLKAKNIIQEAEDE